jgi:hypothetical protein
MSEIKAIETFYKGYHFRSRLEARWAVFFDTLGVQWKYEDQGFEREVFDHVAADGKYVNKTARYLPDFYLPNRYGSGGIYVEVKGDTNALKKDWHRYAEMHDYGGILPDFQDSYGERHGLLLLSEIPEASTRKVYLHPILQHYKGLCKSYAFFDGADLAIVKDEPFTRMLDVAPVHGLDCEEDNWGIDTRQVHAHKYYPQVEKAYAAARAARFEHGQRGVR